MDKWLDLLNPSDPTPHHGDRTIIWNARSGRSEFAYFEKGTEFCPVGALDELVVVRYWMPQPEPPKRV
jgi:hypothetical protein